MVDSPAISSNQNIVSPDLQEYMDKRKREWKAELNCISLGTIISFDQTNQTAKVQINFMKTVQGLIPKPGNTLGLSLNSDFAYKPLINCPVVSLFGGVSSLTFPITTGDTCLVLFCDKDLDKWFTVGGDPQPLPSFRSHDLNDGIVLVGIRSIANKLSSYNPNGVNIKSPLTYADTNLKVSTGASGTFVSADGQVIVVADGIIVGLT